MQNDSYDPIEIDKKSKEKDLDDWFNHAIKGGEPAIKSLIQYLEDQKQLSTGHTKLLNRLRIQLNTAEFTEKTALIEQGKSSVNSSRLSLRWTQIGVAVALIATTISIVGVFLQK